MCVRVVPYAAPTCPYVRCVLLCKLKCLNGPDLRACQQMSVCQWQIVTNHAISLKERPLWQMLLCDWLNCWHFVPNHWQKFHTLSLEISADRDVDSSMVLAFQFMVNFSKANRVTTSKAQSEVVAHKILNRSICNMTIFCGTADRQDMLDVDRVDRHTAKVLKNYRRYDFKSLINVCCT